MGRMDRHITKTLIAIALLVAAPLVGANGRTEQIDLYLDETEMQFNPANDAALPPRVEGELRPGDTIFFRRDAYALDESNPADPQPTGPVIGTNVTECVVSSSFIPGVNPFLAIVCRGATTLNDRGQILHEGALDFVPGMLAVASVPGGSGEFEGVTGQFTAVELPDRDQVYKIELIHQPSGLN